MNKLPEVTSKISDLIEIFSGAISSRLLISAIKLKVFDCLEEPTLAEKVTNLLSLHFENTIHVLDALCSLGLINKHNKTYHNKKVASEFLVTGKPTYIGEWLLQTDKDIELCLEKLPDIIRFGSKVIKAPEHMNSKEYCEKFTASHAATSFAGIANDIAHNVSCIPSFKYCRRMLDLGGGPGVNAMAVVSKNTDLEATIFDRPDIVHLAENYIKEYGFGDRVKTLGGDYLKDFIGSDYDMIMITDSLYYTDSEIDAVLNKCRNALNPSGFFVGIHAVLTEERTQPAHMVLGMLPETVMNSGTLPDKGYLAKALERCGFVNISSEMVMIGGSFFEMNTGYLSVPIIDK
jgi:hypothetical protein